MVTGQLYTRYHPSRNSPMKTYYSRSSNIPELPAFVAEVATSAE
jgi:hypothetical protein